jgi:8-hydroxy-5-deazaflavin:NADPH oxidoreductase
MKLRLILLVFVGLWGIDGRVLAQDKPVVAMIGTGNLAGEFGPAIGRSGYTVVYGSRDPARDVVRALVQRTGPNASAVTQREAVARADVVILGVPGDVLEEVTANLGNLAGKIVVDVSGGLKRLAEDGYLELVSDSTNSERIQVNHPAAHVVRVNLPMNAIPFFLDPVLLGTPPTVLIASDNPRARAIVAGIMFDIGLDPWDAGPLRFSRVFDALNTMLLVPLQQGRTEGYELKIVPGVSLSCFLNVSEFFGFGRPYDLDNRVPFPRRSPPVPCDDWQQRLGSGGARQ